MTAMTEKRTIDTAGNGRFTLGMLRRTLPLFIQISLNNIQMPKDSNYSMPKGYDGYDVLYIAIENAGSIVVTLDL